MKKFIILIPFIFCLISCVSTQGISKEKDTNGIVKIYDEITQSTKYEHPSLKPNVFWDLYNLDNIFADANIDLFIYNGHLYLESLYKCENELAINTNSIFLITEDESISFTNGIRNSAGSDTEVYNANDSYSSIVINYSSETYTVLLNDRDVSNLLNILTRSQTIQICFNGTRGRSRIYKLPDKVQLAMILMLEKYKTLF